MALLPFTTPLPPSNTPPLVLLLQLLLLLFLSSPGATVAIVPASAPADPVAVVTLVTAPAPVRCCCCCSPSCLAVASAQIDCETCKEGVTKLGAYLTLPEEIEKEILLLKTFVCEVDADPEGCAAGVDKYWAGMAEAIFGYSETPADICAAGGLCKKSTRALDCETCAGMIGKLSELFKNEDFINSVLEKVSGFLYCDTAADPAECKAFVDAYGAAAMPVLGDGLVTEAESICTALGCE